MERTSTPQQAHSAQPSTDELRDAAIALLRSLVDEFIAEHRRPLAATLKKVMVDRTYGGFHEIRLGFTSFKHFLEEAQRRGVVTLASTTFPGELLVEPVRANVEPGQTASSVVQSPAPPTGDYGRSPIPNDIWRCFVDWNPGLRRWYHVPSGMALMFPQDPIPMERPEHTAARDKWRAAPEQCVEIPAIGMPRQLEWMREFTEGTSDSGNRRLLEAALAGDRPNSSFSLALRGSPTLWTQWRAFRIDKVREVVKTWAEVNNVVVSVDEASPPPVMPKTRTAEQSQDTPGERALRAKIVQAVERMSIGDLRRLPIPVEYMVDV